jgi:protein strawberry notch
VVHTDEITKAQTTHYTFEVDVPSRAVSFEEADAARQRQGGAFLRHRKNGHFILAVESGRHTDPASGNSYRTFALWKPEAARANYIHDDELNEKYKAVTPERARSWWTQKYDTIPLIETLETHIISGAIIPLWQRLKTNEDARLRVVRVITEDQQRIVGIQIPPDNAGAVLRLIGLTCDLREPDEIFYAVLDEGDEITLASNLKLCRGSIHSDPAIELSGADPYKFAELRKLGLINEQINWKQRFFVPSDKTSGIDILESLLERYPVTLTEGAVRVGESDAPEIAPSAEIRATEIVDLEQWIVAVSVHPEDQTADEIDGQVDVAKPEAATKEKLAFRLTQEAAVSWTHFRQSEQTQLAFSFG